MTLKLDLVGIVVADMAKSLAFYRMLGLEIDPAADVEAHVEVVLGGHMRLGWDTVETIRSFDPSWVPPVGGHRIALAFDCETASEVDSTYAAVIASGHRGHLEPWDAFWGQRYAVVIDPDGNHVELFAAT